MAPDAIDAERTAALEGLMRIPGNAAAYRRLGSLLRSGRALAFVGAGASAPLYPVWKQLIHRLADEAIARGRAEPADYVFWTRSPRPQQALRGIANRLGEGLFRSVLSQIFAPSAAEGGLRFSPAHEALMRMPFAGYVTTNFDRGLLEARHVIRNNVSNTGYAVWKDPDPLWRWLNGDVFRNHECPILHAHGIYERSDTIVVTTAEYHSTYKAQPYRRLFEKLWAEEHLVFVGYGFSDEWLNFIANEVITQTAALAGAEPNHIAILGIPAGESYSAEMRTSFVDSWSAEPLFYRVHEGNDHHELLLLLNTLAESPTEAELPAAPAPVGGGEDSVVLPATSFPVHWVHLATDDEHFVGRENDLARLDRWINDSTVRVVNVTGIGGLGKTALVGKWLKARKKPQARPFKGLFYWSFYIDREVNRFLQTLCEFIENIDAASGTVFTDSFLERAVSHLGRVPILLVLDGIEVKQTIGETTEFDRPLTDQLREFLFAACRSRAQTAVIVTSRFRLSDLNPYLGQSFREMELDRLSTAAGAALLQGFGLGRTHEDLVEVTDALEGHPLALRVFALATKARQKPGEPMQTVLDHIGVEDGSLERKLNHLLEFYEGHLPPERRLLLQIISLFPFPVSLDLIDRAARELSIGRTLPDGGERRRLQQELRILHSDRLIVEQETENDRQETEIHAEYSCHPVLRDYFRRTLLQQNTSIASEFAGFLSGRPSTDRPTDSRTAELNVFAIELLLDAGQLKEADERYREVFDDGKVFMHIPALEFGLRCAEAFIATPMRRKSLVEALSEKRLSYFFNEAGIFSSQTGELRRALEHYSNGKKLDLELENEFNTLRSLQNLAELKLGMGMLYDASHDVTDAIDLALRLDTPAVTYPVDLYALEGHIKLQMGELKDAAEAFSHALRWARQTDHSSAYPESLSGVYWVDFLLRTGQTEKAGDVLDTNLRISQESGWTEDEARYRVLLARLDMARGDFRKAADLLKAAEVAFQTGHMRTALADLWLARTELLLLTNETDRALQAAQYTLGIAECGLALVRADAMILRGRIRLNHLELRDTSADGAETSLLQTIDDAENALEIARQSSYAWAELECYRLLAAIWNRLGMDEKQALNESKAKKLARRLEPVLPVTE